MWRWHGTQDWKGHRVTISAYCSRGWTKVGPEIQDHLRQLGFPGPQIKEREQAYVLKTRGPWSGPLKNQDPKGEEALKRKLCLLHAAADPKVLELARNFRCSVCEERRRVQPRQVASLEPLPPKFHTLTADVGHWVHPGTGEQQNFMVTLTKDPVIVQLESSRREKPKLLTRPCVSTF